METLKLAVTTNSAGAGTATTWDIMGHVDRVRICYATTAATTCDATFSVYNTTYGTQDVLAVSNTNTDGWYYPRDLACTGTGADIAANNVPFYVDGQPKLVVAQGGDTQAVTAYVSYAWPV